MKLVMSGLDVALADALRRRVHFFTFTEEGGVLCRICDALFLTVEAWAADDGVCPGPREEEDTA